MTEEKLPRFYSKRTKDRVGVSDEYGNWMFLINPSIWDRERDAPLLWEYVCKLLNDSVSKDAIKKEIIYWEGVRDRCRETPEMYIEEVKHVIMCIKNKTPSKIISLKNGVDTLLISEIIKKDRSGKKVHLRR